MRSFVAVADARSFSRAARRLGLSQPQVSKHVSALEREVAARLLQRSTRAVALTAEGTAFYEAALRALAATDEAIAAAGGGREARGALRLTMPLTLAEARVMPMLAGFIDAHPRVRIDLKLSDQALDLIADTIDLALRVGELTDSALVARRIGLARRVVVASPDYLARHGTPDTPAALSGHRCLAYGLLGAGPNWRFAGGEVVPIDGPLTADSPIALRAAALAGIGIVLNAAWLFEDDLAAGRLIRLLPDHPPVAMPIHAVLPGGRHVPARTRLLLDHLAAGFAADLLLRPDQA